jgi:spermidine/putrescine transport system ATP-binding protein
VGELLDLVDLADRAGSRPRELSGGQRQRVALARSLVNMPTVLLLDEPLGALDLKLRRQMQIELKRIQREVGITFVYVTHDQEEALTMSDRIGVMNAGRLEQVDAPERLYQRPATAFVAGFIGNTNLLAGTRVADGVELGGGTLVPIGDEARRTVATGEPVAVSIRPEDIVVDGGPVATSVALEGRVIEVVYLGASTQYVVECARGLRLTATESNGQGRGQKTHEAGATVTVGWRTEDTLVLPTTSPTATTDPTTSQTPVKEHA